MTDHGSPAPDSAAESGRVYRTITRYWPRIAVALVALAALAEWVVGGMTADGKLEFYVFAWATMTGGLWFLFEKADRSLSEESRARMAERIRGTDPRASIESLPTHFALLFDRVFGEKHWSGACFRRSCVASYTAVLIVFGLKLSLGSWPDDPESVRLGGLMLLGASAFWAFLLWAVFGIKSRLWQSVVAVLALLLFMAPSMLDTLQVLEVLHLPVSFAGLEETLSVSAFLLLISMALNFFPDYLSLLETRWAIRWMERSGWIFRVVVADFVATVVISLLFLRLVSWLLLEPGFVNLRFDWMEFVGVVLWPPHGPFMSRAEPAFWEFLQISFYSTFFTSVWLWLYAASALVSRAMIRMSGGVGFLLKVTDVERQPFRSMGFTSVVIVTLLFLVGLPFMLLA